MEKKGLSKLLKGLLGRGKEGSYWDFKEEYSGKISDLVKDIVCFANTVHNLDCYIIFGVSDELEVVGVEGKNRVKQADIIDKLSKMHFAGDNVPSVELETIFLEYKEIDILIIKDNVYTPIYLKQNDGEMLRGCIYSREGDRNTPNKGNSDINSIEGLWKKRLGLTKPPLDYFYDRLTFKEEWNGMDNFFYNIYRPEYTVVVNDGDYDGKDEFYFYVMTNPSGGFSDLELRYNGTVLDYYQLAILDSGQLRIPIPEWGYIHSQEYKTNVTIRYKYYIKSSNRYALIKFLIDESDEEELIAFDDLKNIVIFFETEEEKHRFEQYIFFNQQSIIEHVAKMDTYDYIATGDTHLDEIYKLRLNTGNYFVEIYNKWRMGMD